MSLLSLTCGHCGAPLEVLDETRFITCGYCSSRLEVHRSGGAVYTEVLEAIEARTERIAEDMQTLKLQNELERIDREWMMEREQYMVRGKHGGRHIPSKTGAGIMLAFVVGMALLWMITSANVGAGTAMLLFGLAFIGFAVFSFVVMLTKADQYERRQRAYQRRREAILRDIDSQRAADK